MIRTIIKINEDLCNGCGACAKACHEGAIVMLDGKAKLIRDDYCDGLGNCLPVCPTAAITFEEREAAAFDEEAVLKNKEIQDALENVSSSCSHGGCPGSAAKVINETSAKAEVEDQAKQTEKVDSQLRQWPVQIKLVPVKASYFDGANLLIAADCSAYAYADFHKDFIKNHITIIGCPKLDDGNYAEKLTEIIKQNQIKSVKVVRMEVPCCGGIEYAAIEALKNSGKMIPWQVVTISCDGKILEA